jgi:hypothetical protein
MGFTTAFNKNLQLIESKGLIESNKFLYKKERIIETIIRISNQIKKMAPHILLFFYKYFQINTSNLF